MEMIMVQVTIALPLECLIFVVIVYLTFCYLDLQCLGATVVGQSFNGTLDSYNESSSDDSSSDVSDYVSIDGSKSYSPRQQFEQYREFYEFMDKDKLFNLDNYLERD